MEAYLSHHSALAHLPLPLAQDYFRSKIAAAPSLEVTVFHEKHRFRRKGKKLHLCSLKVPSKYKLIHKGKAVVSPELLFLQLATTWSLHETILLGILLCARPNGPQSEPLTTRKKLDACARCLLGHRGRAKALRAVKYIKDECCSIMEAILHMFLTLPNLLGGQALRGAVFNHPVYLDEEGQEALKQERCFLDLCFVKQKIAIEYQGLAAHGDARNIDKDSARVMALSRMGYTVILVTRSQLYHLDKFKQLLSQLAKLLGKRVRIRTEKFAKALAFLRNLLPRKERLAITAGDDLKTVLRAFPYYERLDFLSFLQSLRVPNLARAP